MSSGTQLHDFNPGTTPFPNGLVWVVPLTRSNLQVNLDAGQARLNVSNVAVSDYTNIVNAFTSDPPPIPEIAATVSFDIHWSNVITRVQRNNPTEGFAGTFVETNATINWTATQTASPFFSFATDAPNQTTVFAQIGHERNGSFYHQG